MLFFVFFIFFSLLTSPVLANKLFIISPIDNYGKVKKEKVFYIGRAEPAFGVLYDLKPPKKYFLLSPDSNRTKLTLLRIEYEDKALNIKRIGYKTKVIPEKKGDYYLCVESDYFLTRELKVIKSFAKAPFHVEIEKGWDNLCGFELEIKPYTRPYGFSDKGIFWGQVLYRDQPLSNVIVEFERFSPTFLTLDELPKDFYGDINYPYLKRTVKTNKEGFFVVSLEEPGWWVITVKKKAGVKALANNLYPFEIVSHFWIYVFPSQKKDLGYGYYFLKTP